MALIQGSSEWPPAHWPETTVESQRILLSRRKGALVASFLIAHVPLLRDDVGCSLVWNRHLEMNVKERKEFQNRKIGPSANKISGLGRRALKMGARGESQFSVVTPLPWLGDTVNEYVRTDLPRIAGEAVRKFGPDAVAVPDVRPTKDERLLFPGYNSSSFWPPREAGFGHQREQTAVPHGNRGEEKGGRLRCPERHTFLPLRALGPDFVEALGQPPIPEESRGHGCRFARFGSTSKPALDRTETKRTTDNEEQSDDEGSFVA